MGQQGVHSGSFCYYLANGGESCDTTCQGLGRTCSATGLARAADLAVCKSIVAAFGGLQYSRSDIYPDDNSGCTYGDWHQASGCTISSNRLVQVMKKDYTGAPTCGEINPDRHRMRVCACEASGNQGSPSASVPTSGPVGPSWLTTGKTVHLRQHQMVIASDGTFTVNGDILGTGHWLSATRYVVQVQAWGANIWWIGEVQYDAAGRFTGMMASTARNEAQASTSIPTNFEPGSLTLTGDTTGSGVAPVDDESDTGSDEVMCSRCPPGFHHNGTHPCCTDPNWTGSGSGSGSGSGPEGGGSGTGSATADGRVAENEELIVPGL